MSTFVQSGFLFAAAAMAIPVLVHLLSRRQVRKIELGTMRFLQEVIQKTSHRRKIRRWLLLLTRVAACLLLALLFARPFLPEKTKRDGDRLRIVLVDRSASMGMPGKSGRLIDDAVAAASDSLNELGADAKVLWAWFDQEVQPLPVSNVRPSAPQFVLGDTDYLSALSWARDKIDGNANSVADVVLVTDLQQSGLSADKDAIDSLAFPNDVPVRIIDVGRVAANNLAITNIEIPAKRLETVQEVPVLVTLFNYGSLPFEEVPLHATAYDGKRRIRLKKSINLPGGQAEEVAFDFGKLSQGTWQITVEMDVNDDLASDNRRRSALQVASPIRILVLDSGSESDGVESESYYLVTALEQSDRERPETDGESGDSYSRFHADVVYLNDDPQDVFDPKVNPLIVVADAAGLSKGAVVPLTNYVRSGGKLLVFAGDGDHASESGQKLVETWSQAELSPGELKPPLSSGVMPFRITSIQPSGTMLQPFQDPQHGDLSRLAFRKLLPVAVKSGAEVLASFDRNRPALTQHRIENGRVVWFLASVDASWGNWIKSPLYLPLIQQMASDLLNLTGEGPIRFRTIGDHEPFPEAIANSQPKPVNIRNVALSQKDETSSKLQVNRTGFNRPGFDQRKDALYVVNGSAKESDPARLEPAAFVEHFDLALADESNVLAASVIGEQKNELWHWLAAALFVLLLAEYCLANRTTA